MSDVQDFISPSIAPLLDADPMAGQVRLVALTDAERAYLLDAVGNAESGPEATLRLKLRGAAPVKEWDASQTRWQRLRDLLTTIFHSDGKERGTCRWCKRRDRVDQYELCAACTPPRRILDDRLKAHRRHDRNLEVVNGHR